MNAPFTFDIKEALAADHGGRLIGRHNVVSRSGAGEALFRCGTLGGGLAQIPVTRMGSEFQVGIWNSKCTTEKLAKKSVGGIIWHATWKGYGLMTTQDFQ